MIFWLATVRVTDLGSYVAWNSKSSSYSLSVEGVGWGGHYFIWSKRVCYHCVMVFRVLASCTGCLFGSGLGWSKLGVREPRLSAKFKFRYENYKLQKAN